ncbi:IpaD/SipD/SspD family type III secretion system needle tip protein [Candidatus Fukatsuia endosymbiont of Tuberolachnus salignus]
MGEVLNTSNNITFLSVGLHNAKGVIEPDTKPAGGLVQLKKESVNSLTTGNERVEELKKFTRELRIDNKKVDELNQEEHSFLSSVFKLRKEHSENNIVIHQNIEKLTRLNEKRDHLLQGNSSSENDIEKNSEEIKETSKKLEDLTQKKNRELRRLASLEEHLSSSDAKIELATHSMSSSAAAYQTILKQVTPWLSKIDPEKLEEEIKGEMATVLKELEMQTVSDALSSNYLFSSPIQPKGATKEKMLSSSEIANKLIEGINTVKEHYLDIHQNASKKYSDFYKEFSDIVTKMGKSNSSSGDKVVIQTGEIYLDLIKLKDKYAVTEKAGQLYVDDSDKRTKKWVENLGLSTDIVKVEGVGHVVGIDIPK